ncbi:glycerophosphodiester phosphodiesterase family protein [Herbiconiux sp. CPCC 205716]|uniref:Glycerophosphodiester phosphodiesterase family protein n=1 Tax=Herbiconiux gentiana TaxID=2970912 RepID=A0ABT2GAC3_9MICO|nr:glycerophosphodiester phosphodiesterase family protein [Herbiconiux gentiana]MCS5713120.1 glycerophosphodiester phosphodiesterase family protein [Herbiconiux gentiana]
MARRRASRSEYFSGAFPRVLAHRGLAVDVPENTLAAFEAAVGAGAEYLETDVHATADGIAVAAHDPTLDRVAGRDEDVSALTLEQLVAIDLGAGQRLSTLAELLVALPTSRFNIDVKAEAAAAPAAAAIEAAGARERVLLTSFSSARRRSATVLLPGVAASASAQEFVPALIAAKLGLTPLARWFLRRVDAVQIPRRVGRFETVTARTVRRLHAAGVEVHVWTINDVDEARLLLERGVDGIVTDRVDLMLPLAAEFRRHGGGAGPRR